MQERDSFNSQFGLIFAAIGSAIGLGNIWRFPYLVGQNGGGAFIFVYLIFVILFGLPLIISELVIGRRTKVNAVFAFRKLSKNPFFSKAGYLQIISCFFILSFYCVVGGWAIYYFYKSITFSLIGLSSAELSQLFSNFTHSVTPHLVSMLIFMIFAVCIVLGGIENGIEKVCKVLMPLLFLLIIVLMIRSLTLEGSQAGIEFLIFPDFSKINSSVVLIALGQALFSLSIGAGILTYGSYMRKQDNIVKSAYYIAISDALFALLAGLAIIPAVFALGFEPTEGPGLVFIVLPEIFSKITGGDFLQILFFFALIIAAITSAISLLETTVAYVLEEWKVSRKIATIISAILITIVGSFCALSINKDSTLVLFGKNIFNIIEAGTSNIILPLSAASVAILVGWRMNKVDAFDEITNSGTLRIRLVYFFLFLLKFVVPIALLIILIGGIL